MFQRGTEPYELSIRPSLFDRKTLCGWVDVCVDVWLCEEAHIVSGVLCLFPLHNEEVMSSQTSCWLPLSNSLPSACRWFAIVHSGTVHVFVFKRVSICLPLSLLSVHFLSCICDSLKNIVIVSAWNKAVCQSLYPTCELGFLLYWSTNKAIGQWWINCSTETGMSIVL